MHLSKAFQSPVDVLCVNRPSAMATSSGTLNVMWQRLGDGAAAASLAGNRGITMQHRAAFCLQCAVMCRSSYIFLRPLVVLSVSSIFQVFVVTPWDLPLSVTASHKVCDLSMISAASRAKSTVSPGITRLYKRRALAKTRSLTLYCRLCGLLSDTGLRV